MRKKLILTLTLFCLLAMSFQPLTSPDRVNQPRVANVLLDRYYNSETRTDSNGVPQFFHYTWEEKGFGGFSELGNLFKERKASLHSSDGPPDLLKLQDMDIYIIVDPDHPGDRKDPNYMGVSDIPVIKSWVDLGGILLLLANDSLNNDLYHLNKLSHEFGIHFSGQTVNRVLNDQFATGSVTSVQSSIISSRLKMFMKDASALELSGKAVPLATNGKEILMAYARYGKGLVIAVGDPWLYNEYMDDRRGLKGFDNRESARQLIAWILPQVRQKKYTIQ